MPAIFGITVPSWAIGSASEKEDPPALADETESEPLQHASVELGNADDGEHRPTNIHYAAKLECSRQGSASDVTSTVQTQSYDSNTAVKGSQRKHYLTDTVASSARATLQPPRPPTRRSISSSLIETRSCYHDLGKVFIDHQGDTAARATGTDEYVPRQKTRSKTSGLVYSGAQRPGASTDSYSSPSLRTTEVSYRKPLKTCLKQKVNNTTTTPSSEVKRELKDPTDDLDGRKLRRVKTVDFEISKPLICITPAAVVSDQMRSSTFAQTERLSGQNVRSLIIRRAPTCPSTFGTIKSDPAGPAVTRTDVRVIAVSQSSSRELKAAQRSGDCDPATPTMQIMESDNGVYEVVWDDVPADHDYRESKSGSNAGKALGASSSTAVRGLERVNTKLTEWSGSWNGPSDHFKPITVVYPDEDSHQRYSQYSIGGTGDEEDVVVPPPNSERTSAMPSRRQSRRASSCVSSVTSEDEQAPTSRFQGMSSTSPSCSEQPSHMGPVQGVWSDHLVAARERLEDSVSARKLSDLNKHETTFRGHRDSITIARDRLSKSTGYIHKDSIALAKKRMYAKERATSGARDVNRLDTKLDLGVWDDGWEREHIEGKARPHILRDSLKSVP
jgi:hypothetical protein